MAECNEEISALVDGELSHGDVRPLAHRLQQDQELMQCWQRYHLISDAMRNKLPRRVCCDLTSRISQAISSEPIHHVSFRRRAFNHSFLKPMAGFALAASVAAVAYLGVQSGFDTPAPAMVTTAAVAPAAIQASAAVPAPQKVAQHGKADQPPALESKLNDYLLSHNEFAPAAVKQSLLSHVRVVGYESSKDQ